MEPILIGLLLGSLFCIVTIPRLYVNYISDSKKKNYYEEIEK